jgi:NADH-quinone oxidoreductase subunit M
MERQENRPPQNLAESAGSRRFAVWLDRVERMRFQLSIVLWIPALAAVVLLLVDRRSERAISLIASVAVSLAFLVSLPLWFLYQPREAEWQFVERIEWFPAIGSSYSLGVDGLSLTFVLLSTLAGCAAVFASLGVGHRTRDRLVAILLVQFGVLGILMSLDLLLFFLFWLLTILASAVLARMSGAPARTAVTFGAGGLVLSGLLLAAILGLYFQYHALASLYTFDVRPFRHISIPAVRQTWIFLAFLGTFAGTATLFAYQLWMSPSRSGMPGSASILIAAALLKVGVYGLLRISLPVVPEASRLFSPALVILGIVTIAAAVIFSGRAMRPAFAGSEWTRPIAWATFGNLGLALLAVFALTPASLNASILQQVGLGLVTAALLPGLHPKPLMMLIAAIVVLIGLYPAPLLWRTETSVARVVMRASPEYAAQVADCLTQAAPPTVDPGLPAGIAIAVPCNDGSSAPASQPPVR